MAPPDAASPAVRGLRVAVLSELPTPYRWPLFQRVAERPGLDVTVLFYARTEADRDWGLDVQEGDGCPRVIYLAGKALPVRGKRSLFFHFNPEIRSRLAEGDYDVVVVPGWSMPTTILAIAWCWFHRVPYVLFSETHARTRRSWWLRLLKRVLLRPFVGWAKAWLATGTLSEEYLALHGARRAGIFRFANTPDVEEFQRRVDAERPRRAETRASLAIPEDAVVALFVGRLIGAKDPAGLLAAQALCETRGSPGWLLLVGDGAEAKALEAEARERILGRVTFAGPRRPGELPALFAAADLFVLPSLHEPWGVVVNEALAAGLPVVLSDRVGAAADLLVDGENGFVVPAGDPGRLAEALGDLYGNDDLRRVCGEASRRIVKDWGYLPSVEGFERAVRHAAADRAKANEDG